MPLLEDLLLRFRRIWSPPGGVVGQSGVPEEAGSDLDSEVRSVTAELAAIELDAAAVERAAVAEAGSLVEAARSEAARTVEIARTALPAVRAQSASARARGRQSEIDDVTGSATRRGHEIRERAHSRIPALATRVADLVLGAAVEEDADARVVGGS